MSKLSDTLGRLGVRNPALFNARQPYIWHHAYSGRGSFGSAWVVTKRGENLTAENANWHEKPNRWFNHAGRDDNALALAEAQVWAAERFGIENVWKRDPFGAYASAAFVEARTAYLLYTVSLLDLLADGPLDEGTLRQRVAGSKQGRKARPTWFETALALLSKEQRIAVDADGLLRPTGH